MFAVRWVAAAIVLLALSGCVYALRGAGVQRYAWEWTGYWCDVGNLSEYRYVDPYYDWCAGYGFRYDWGRHPRVITLYRERYLALRREHREFGRYTYPRDYRRLRRYREPLDYEAWRTGESGRSDSPRRIREQGRKDPGITRKREAPHRDATGRGSGHWPREDTP